MTDLVLGVDSSTQSCKALVVDAADGTIVDLQQVAHPDGTEVDPSAWDKAFAEAAAPQLSRVKAVAIGGQQHGMVCLDAEDRVVRPALLWNDTRSAPQAAELIAELGGPEESARRTGSVLVPSITSTKLRWLAENEPENAQRTATVLLPHDYLTWKLQADSRRFVTDRSEASGTGYFSPQLDGWDTELVEMALGKVPRLPEIVAPEAAAGETAAGVILGAGMGDNAAAALGLDLQPGQVLVSLGTSGVASTVAEAPVADPTGMVAGFADATGRWLPISVTLNCARILQFARRLLGVDNDRLAELALAAPAGANGTVLLPYLDGERTPNRPNARGTLHGLTTATTPEDIARAAFEAMLCSVADEIQALDRLTGRPTTSVMMIGGATRSPAVKEIAPAVLGMSVSLPADGEYVARGAARQAAWALSGKAEPPQWPQPDSETHTAEATPEVLQAYRQVRDLTEDWT
ncbi:xylulokinase [Naumannella halotolerans]|uniref:xylulokinase n=1 Tax=Naumannella halotolerans TaxID=993414 RepID=UPI00370DBD1E